jgi:cellobiose-specific phosphotransferase system component IIC
MMMIFTDLHVNLVFQLLTFSLIILVIIQIKTADQIDKIRGHHHDWLFAAKRWTLVFKGLAAAWMVSYSYVNNWTPWPPVILLIAVLNAIVVFDVMIMRRDIVKEYRRSNGEMGVRSR